MTTLSSMTRAEIVEMKPGRELDALIANEVMGGSPVRGMGFGERYDWAHYSELIKDYVWNEPRDSAFGFLTVPVPHYSTDPAAMWLVIEAMRTRANNATVNDETHSWWLTLADRGNSYSATFFDINYTALEYDFGNWKDAGEEYGIATYDTAPHAVCIAALLARKAELDAQKENA